MNVVCHNELAWIEKYKKQPKRRLTSHQREVYDRIVRWSRRRGWARSVDIACSMACSHLIEKGWIEHREVVGPRGGTTYEYRPVEEDA